MKILPTSIRLNERQKEILDELCKKYGKTQSQMIIFLLEKEYYFNKEDDKQ